MESGDFTKTPKLKLADAYRHGKRGIEMARVKVFIPNGTGWMGTQCEIDGKQMEDVKRVNFNVAVDEMPCFTFEMYGMPEIEMEGDIRFQFTPETVRDAAKVIRNEFRPGTEYYAAMVVSVENRLKWHIRDDRERRTVAEGIVKQILGI